MMNLIKQFLGIKSNEKEQQHGGWSSQKLSSGDILCTLYGAVNSMVLLKPCPHTSEVYYIADGGQMPMQRNLACMAAMQSASLNYTPDDLQSALAELTEIAHNEKSIIQARIKIQSAAEAMAARCGGQVQKAFLEELALPFMVLKGENPFMYSNAFSSRKLGILRAEFYISDFFLTIAREVLQS